MKTISIVVYEDNESYRSYLCSLFEFDPSISLKDAFGNCNNCVEEIRTLEPDVVLMDLRMPNSNDGLDGLKKLKDAFPELRIIMLTDSDYPDDIFSCVQAKPSGYINKRKTDSAQIINSIKSVARQEADRVHVYSSDVISMLTEFIQGGAPQNTNKFGLTATELKVLQLLAFGMSEKMIANESNVARETVHEHKKNIYRKLGVHSETEAIKFAHENRLLPPEMLRHKS